MKLELVIEEREGGGYKCETDDLQVSIGCGNTPVEAAIAFFWGCRSALDKYRGMGLRHLEHGDTAEKFNKLTALIGDESIHDVNDMEAIITGPGNSPGKPWSVTKVDWRE